MKKALVILLVAALCTLSLTAKSGDDSLRFGFEGGWGKNKTNAVTTKEEKNVDIKDSGFYGDGVVEYHLNDNWGLKITGGVQYRRKAEVKVGEEDMYRLDSKTGLSVEASVLIRYTYYKYDGFALYASLGAQGFAGLVGPESETYDRDTLTNIGVGVAGEIGTEIEIAYREYLTLGVKGSYIIYNSTKLAKDENSSLSKMSMCLLRPYVGLAFRID